ncbi:hypothetical protein MasN3_03550 [Massilia varians]|uniref:Uncharacterized protein n=1 Tax=Massilia varians TaxID=457921 RepID=A0ABM8C101_9BURK|nr:hypothetical protein [Massilia varians]BDT56861.1 hypothetical protein MasN3_03550 [Massilia varians]
MIDNIAILIFSSAIVYTVFRAVKLDKVLPWFSADSDQQLQALQLKEQKKSRKGIRK